MKALRQLSLYIFIRLVRNGAYLQNRSILAKRVSHFVMVSAVIIILMRAFA